MSVIKLKQSKETANNCWSSADVLTVKALTCNDHAMQTKQNGQQSLKSGLTKIMVLTVP